MASDPLQQQLDEALDVIDALVRHARPCRGGDACVDETCAAVRRAIELLEEHRPPPDYLGDVLVAWNDLVKIDAEHMAQVRDRGIGEGDLRAMVERVRVARTRMADAHHRASEAYIEGRA